MENVKRYHLWKILKENGLNTDISYTKCKKSDLITILTDNSIDISNYSHIIKELTREQLYHYLKTNYNIKLPWPNFTINKGINQIRLLYEMGYIKEITPFLQTIITDDYLSDLRDIEDEMNEISIKTNESSIDKINRNIQMKNSDLIQNRSIYNRIKNQPKSQPKSQDKQHIIQRKKRNNLQVNKPIDLSNVKVEEIEGEDDDSYIERTTYLLFEEFSKQMQAIYK